MSAIRKIGFIGIGNMGAPMAGHLVKKGYDVTVYDVRPEVTKTFVAQHGGRVASSLVDAAHGMDATLDIMVGGEPAQVERVKPVLAAIGRNLIACGGTGTAHAMKAFANYINACALINVVEAMTIGRKFGLDSQLMAEAFTTMCAGRNHPVGKKIVPHVLTRKFGTGMALGFIAKDVKVALDTARAVGAHAPLAERVSELWSAAAGQLGGELDHTQIARYWEDATGVKL